MTATGLVDPENAKKLGQFAGVDALIIGTILTVLASYHRFPNHSMNIALALAIACVKVFLVAGFFMHLISEKKMIFSVLSFTAFFFAGLMFLTLFSLHDFPKFTVTH